MVLSRFFFAICLALFSINFSTSQTIQEQELINATRKVARNPEKLKSICFQLLESTNQHSLFEGNYGLGYANLTTNQLDSASYYYKNAFLIAKTLEDKQYESKSLLKLQTVNSALGNQDSLYKYVEISKKFAEENNDLRLLAETYKYEGLYYKNIKKYEESINANIEAAKINKQINNPMIVNNYGNIAIIYKRMHQDSLAYHWFLRAFHTSENFNYYPSKFGATNNLANFHYTSLKQLDSARYYYEILLADSLKQNPSQRNVINLNLFSIHLEQDSLANAKVYLDKLHTYWKRKPLSKRKAEYFDEASQFYYKNKEYKNALVYNDSAIAFVKDQNLSDKILFLMLERSSILEALTEHKKANKVYKEFIELKDSLLLLNDSEAMQNSINEFKLAEREEALLKQLESSNSKLYIFVVVGFVFLIGLYFALKKKETQQEEIPTYITLSSNERLNCNLIEYIKSDGHYLEYYLIDKDKPIYERSSLKHALERLTDCPFIQTHRSYLVNTSKIAKIRSKEIHLSSGASIPLSRSFKEKLKQNEHPLFV